MSISGVKVIARTPYNIGDLVEVEAQLEPDTRCRMVVSILGSRDSAKGWYGYGATYVGISNHDRGVLLKALDGLP